MYIFETSVSRWAERGLKLALKQRPYAGFGLLNESFPSFALLKSEAHFVLGLVQSAEKQRDRYRHQSQLTRKGRRADGAGEVEVLRPNGPKMWDVG